MLSRPRFAEATGAQWNMEIWMFNNVGRWALLIHEPWDLLLPPPTAALSARGDKRPRGITEGGRPLLFLLLYLSPCMQKITCTLPPINMKWLSQPLRMARLVEMRSIYPECFDAGEEKEKTTTKNPPKHPIIMLQLEQTRINTSALCIVRKQISPKRLKTVELCSQSRCNTVNKSVDRESAQAEAQTAKCRQRLRWRECPHKAVHLTEFPSRRFSFIVATAWRKTRFYCWWMSSYKAPFV